MLAAAGGMGIGEAQTCERRLVGGADLVPEPHGFGQRLFCAGRIALDEPHPSSSEGGTGDQRFAREAGGDELQLVGRRSGPADVADRDLDLDLRLEQRRALQVGVRWPLLRGHPQRALERVSYGGSRGGRVSLGQAHQSETRLGIPPSTMSGQQGFLRARDVSLVKSDPSELVQRPSELAPQVRAQFLAGHEHLTFRIVARPAQPEDLGAVDPAAPVEAPDGIRLTPPLHRLGPLLGHVILGEALQRADELAVDDTCRERIEVPGHGRHPGLVEQRQTLLDIPVQDEQPGFCYPSEGARRRVPHRAHLDGTPGRPPSAGQVAGEHPLEGADDRDPRVRRRVTPTFEKPLRSCHPAAHGCHEGGVEQQVHRDANGRACCRDLVTCLHACGVGALPRLDGHIEMAGRVGDLAEHRQIGGAEEAVPVRLHEQLEGPLPVSPGGRVTCSLDEAKTSATAHRTPPDPWPTGARVNRRRT